MEKRRKGKRLSRGEIKGQMKRKETEKKINTVEEKEKGCRAEEDMTAGPSATLDGSVSARLNSS